MDVREKLVELLDEAEEWANHKCDELDCETCPARKMRGNCFQQLMVGRLIDNGVTVQEQDGCEYCNGLPFSQMEDFTMPNASKKDYDIVTIRYCPICGRRLPQPPKGE